MATCFQPLSPASTAVLTRAMVQSGETLPWGNRTDNDHRRRVDKHSTGGVGDKVSIVLIPLVASFDAVQVPMMAGRGLGHTGGTIDKLESIPHFQATNFGVKDIVSMVHNVGCIITTTGPTLCPADQKLYALRDVTGTVRSIPLQTASIMCKKIAEGPHSLVLDVKYGQGAFQETWQEAQELAMSMVQVGEANGLTPTVALLTNMDHPLGRAVGNWLEVYECLQILKGDFSKSEQLVELIVYLAAQMLHQSGAFHTETLEDLVVMALDALKDGRALQKFREMVIMQGGDVDTIDNPDTYPKAAHTQQLLADKDGVIGNIDALVVGQVSVLLGSGRSKAGDPVDPTAGIWLHCHVGDSVQQGSVLADVYTNRSHIVLEKALQQLSLAIPIDPVGTKVVIPPIISHKVTIEGCQPVTMPAPLGCLRVDSQAL